MPSLVGSEMCIRDRKYFKEYPDIEEHWDEKYGDRETKLVFIGQHMDKQNIIERLDNCLDD